MRERKRCENELVTEFLDFLAYHKRFAPSSSSKVLTIEIPQDQRWSPQSQSRSIFIYLHPLPVVGFRSRWKGHQEEDKQGIFFGSQAPTRLLRSPASCAQPPFFQMRTTRSSTRRNAFFKAFHRLEQAFSFVCQNAFLGLFFGVLFCFTHVHPFGLLVTYVSDWYEVGVLRVVSSGFNKVWVWGIGRFDVAQDHNDLSPSSQIPTKS